MVLSKRCFPAPTMWSPRSSRRAAAGRATLPVDADGKCARALVYIGRTGGMRRAMPGYQERLVVAAQEWKLPPRYIEDLRRLAPGYRGARPAETGEIA